jgi:hypothetical protein
MRKPAPIAVVLFALLSTTPGASASPAMDGGGAGGPAPARNRYVIVAAGDIACQSDPNGPSEPALCQYDDTGRLIDGPRVEEVLALGDIQYETGGYQAFLEYFDPTWGRALANISPVPGNHEYGQDPSSRPGGYFRYFGRRVRGPDGLGYYSYDLGACPDAPCWHLIALSSELCFASGGCGPASDPDDPGPGNRMFAWLQADLAAHPDAAYPCTLAYWHHPRFAFSTGSGATAAVAPLWELLREAGADVVLSGHSHNYQRWRPQDSGGNVDPDGIRQFVVGTGGRSLYAIPSETPPANLAAVQARAFGVLRLTLKAEGYRWEFVTARGQPSYADASEHGVPCARATP